MWQKTVEIMAGAWLVLGEMSPYLLLGFLVAGVLSVLVSRRWVEQHLGGRGVGPVVKATVLGVPLPLCSCGVIPVAASLRQHGASRGATSAFLLATPQTGVDSILATYALLGPVLAVIRPVVALVTGLVGGTLIEFAARGDEKTDAATGVLTAEADDACAGKGKDCCDTSDQAPKHGFSAKTSAALRYALVTLPRDIARPLLLGVLAAAVLAALVGQGSLEPYLGRGMLGLFVMMLVGIPVYVCATGSIPLAVAFLHLGASPGAALVFLIAGPATNVATITVNWKLLGRRTTVIYLLTTAGAALGSGYLLDLLAGYVSLGIPSAEHTHALAGPGWMIHVWAGLLLLMLVGSVIPSRFLPARLSGGSVSGKPQDADHRQTAVLQVIGMRCSHCADAVGRALRELPGVQQAQVDLDAGRATVWGTGLDRPGLVRAIEALGYRASEPSDQA